MIRKLKKKWKTKRSENKIYTEDSQVLPKA